MMRLFWPLMYTVSCALATFFFTAGATYWNWEIGAYAGAGGAVFGFLGYLLIQYGPKRPDPYIRFNTDFKVLLGKFEAAVDIGWMWRRRAEGAEVLLDRTLMYLTLNPGLYHEVQTHFARIKEANRDREKESG